MNGKIKYGICKCGCSEKEKALYAKGYRESCYWKHRAEANKLKRIARGEPGTKPKKAYSIPKYSKNGKKVANEDVKFFKTIWNNRTHYSEVSSEFLGPHYSAFFMSHILTKAAYPGFRHLDENICLMTVDEHRMWENGDRSTPEFKAKFGKVLQKSVDLVQQYYS